MKFAQYRRNFQQPLWIGGDIAGKTILLHGEQGFSDSIQFSRYATDVARRGATVLLECPPSLVPLLAGIEGVSKVIAATAAAVRFSLSALVASRMLWGLMHRRRFRPTGISATFC